MLGRRFPDGDWPTEPGGYAKTQMSDGTVVWVLRVPIGGSCFMIGDGSGRDANGQRHWVQEHEDGTITVQPNPPDARPERRNSNSILFNGWHGYIYRGEWRSL